MTAAPTAPPAVPPKTPWPPGAVRALWVLSVTQIIAWGTLYYGITLIGPRIVAETGWSKTLVYGAFSLAMLTSGLIAPRVGALIDARGGRGVMALGSIVGGLGYALLSVAASPAMVYLAYAVIGLGMAGSLYDPAFASLARLAGGRARTAITILTLGGGLASTVFWPLGLWLLEAMDWRGLCLVYALLNGVVCALLHGAGLASRKAPPGPPGPKGAQLGDHPLIPPGARNRAIALLAVIFMAHGLVSNGMSVHLVTLLGSLGLSEAQAVAVGALIGPSQSLGRLIELGMGGAYPVIWLGYVAIGTLPLAFLLILLAGASLAAVHGFAVIYGLSNGLATIARGVMVLGLLGRDNYGRTLGAIAAPTLAMKAAAPAAFALVIEHFGAKAALAMMLGCGLVSLAGVVALAGLARKVAAGSTPEQS